MKTFAEHRAFENRTIREWTYRSGWWGRRCDVPSPPDRDLFSATTGFSGVARCRSGTRGTVGDIVVTEAVRAATVDAEFETEVRVRTARCGSRGARTVVGADLVGVGRLESDRVGTNQAGSGRVGRREAAEVVEWLEGSN
jgi:hypothetical protein